MSTKGKTYGCTTLQKLKDRSRIDEETGCWVWAGSMTRGQAAVRAPAGTLGPEPKITKAHILAWVLSGRKRPDGSELCRIPSCMHSGCINPAHRRPGTRTDAMRAASERGTLSRPEKALRMKAAQLKQALTLEQVQAIQAMRAEGKTQREIRLLTGHAEDTVRRIDLGLHIRQRSEQRGASVFSLGVT